jgi:membrane associated rhomboid family serine protease
MKITFNSPVILTFSFVCAAVYILTGPFGLFKEAFLLYPAWNMGDFIWYFRLFSNTVGHANIAHLMANLPLILLLGPIVEQKYGSKRTFFMFFITAFVSSLIHITFSSYALLGASGIVFMLILLVSLVNIKNNEIPLTFILVVILFLGNEVIGMFRADNISQGTHIVGGIIGTVYGFMLNRIKPM